ncbi:MAG: hypothetical protein M1269_04925 [Chloroflexi bacterium]|nr:hypothetical protein [Chloroflexota bacterium]
MNILIAGFGNIGRAIDSLLRNSKSTKVSSIYLCDNKFHGITVQEWIKKYYNKINLVINLTGEPTDKILSLCQEYNLDYIDTCIELSDNDSRTLATAFQEIRSTKSNVKALIGFGMNPGIIEYIYSMSMPKTRHIAVEFEYDTATLKGDQVFNTWSPTSYYLESIIEPPFFYSKKHQIYYLPSPGAKIEALLNIDGIKRIFHLIPHEELISIGDSNRYCELCAFFYQPPLSIQEFIKDNLYNINFQKVKNILPPTSEIFGEDTVGIIIDSGNKHLSYHFNKASHSECIRTFKDRDNKGVNATSWQVACGIFVALELISFVDPGIYTMSNLATKFSSQIEKILSELNFYIDYREFDSQKIGWENINNIIQL